MPSLFSQLRGASFRGVPMPIVELRNGIEHDQATHAAVGVDGARIEPTGRQARTFAASIPFRNTIKPGPAEGWERGKLYPDGYRAFLGAMADKSQGVLVHPEFGELRVFPKHCTSVITASRTDGADVEATWTEGSTTEEESDDLLTTNAPAFALQAAREVDARLAAKPPPGPARPPADSFEVLLQSVLNAPGKAWLRSQQAGALIGRAIYRAETFVDTLERAGNPSDWPTLRALQSLLSMLHVLKQKVGAQGARVRVYTIPSTIAPAALAVQLRVPVTTLLALNPTIARVRRISPGTQVRYLAGS